MISYRKYLESLYGYEWNEAKNLRTELENFLEKKKKLFRKLLGVNINK